MRDFADTVRDSADFVRVVSDYVQLRGAGNTLKGLCPFHSEKTPSFTVHRDKQFFYCFGCHAGGDVFKFVMLAERVSFSESVRIIAEKCGIPIPSDPGFSDKKLDERKQLFETYERSAAYFRQMLTSPEAAPARQVLEKRQVQASFVERFGLGYAPASGLLAHLKPQDPISTGLFVKSERGEVYDRFRRRLMFPIWNERGKVIGFGGRALGDAQPKYLNSAESPLYTKSYVLYALHLAREAAQKAGRIVVVEGYFDCLSLHQAGFDHVVASCGTSLTQQQVALMARYVPEVVMNYDPDAAGQNAMRRSIELVLAKGLRLRILALPGSLDPDDFVRKEGRDVYEKLLSAAPYFWQYLMADAGKRFDLEQPSTKAAAVRDVLDHVAKIADRVEQLEVARAVAEGFKLPEAVVLERLNLTGRKGDVKSLRRQAAPPAPVRRLPDAEKQLIQALGQDEAMRKVLQPFLQEEFWNDAWSWPVLKRLIESSSNLEAALEDLQDEELARQVREANMQSDGRLTVEHVVASVQKLYDAHLVKKDMAVREQLKQCGPEGAPADLLQKRQEIVQERHRLAKTLKTRMPSLS